MKGWLLLACLLVFSFTNSLEAKYVAIECVSGDCSRNLFAEDQDFTKELSETVRSGVSLAIDIEPLLIKGDFHNSFHVIAYQIRSNGEKQILASTDVLIPYKPNSKEMFFRIKLEPFEGSKDIYFAVHRVDGSLFSIYKANYSFSSTLANPGPYPSHDGSLSPVLACADKNFSDCNLDNLFFNKLQFESTRSKNFRIRKSIDGIYKISIPTLSNFNASAIKTPAKRSSGLDEDPDPSDNGIDSSDILQFTRLGLGTAASNAALEINTNNTDIAALKFSENQLTKQPIEGAFEFNNGELYFTRRGQRHHVVLNQFSSNIPAIPSIPSVPALAPVANLAKILESDNSGLGLSLTGGHTVSFTSTAASNLTLPTSGTLATLTDLILINTANSTQDTNITNLQTDLTNLQSTVNLGEAKKLLDTNLINSMTLTGANDVVLTTTGATNLTLPTTGTVATIDDVIFAAVGAVPNNSVTSAKIVDGSIVDADISASANIAGSKLANTSVTLGKLAANSVDSSKIVDGTVVDADISASANIAGSKLSNTSVTLGKLAANSVDSSKIVDGSVSSADITDNTIVSADIFDGTITGTDISNGSIVLADLANNSVDSARIVDNTIVSADIFDGTITGTDISNGSILLADLANNSVDSSKIVDASIALADLANNSVDSARIVAGTIVDSDISGSANIAGSKIADASITAAKLAANIITSAAISNGTVALADLAADSVDSTKILDGSIVDGDISATANINGSKLLNASVSTAKLSTNSIDSSKITDGSIVDADISASANINASKLLNASITLGKMANDSVDSSKIVNGSIALADMAANSVDSSKIVDGSIVDGDVSATANINGSKLLNASITLAKLANDSVDSSKILDASIQGTDIAAATISADRLQTLQITNVTTNYTLVASDRGKVLEVTGAGPIVITLPNSLGAGFHCEINNISGATVTLAAGAGASLVSRSSLVGVSTQYASVRLRTRTATQWIASGDLN